MHLQVTIKGHLILIASVTISVELSETLLREAFYVDVLYEAKLTINNHNYNLAYGIGLSFL